MCKSSSFCFSGELQVTYLGVLATGPPGNSLHPDACNSFEGSQEHCVEGKKKKIQCQRLFIGYSIYRTFLNDKSTKIVNR